MTALQELDRYWKKCSSEYMYRNVLMGSVYLWDSDVTGEGVSITKHEQVSLYLIHP